MIDVDKVQYNQLLADEIAIAKAFLLLHYADYDSVQTNVRVGRGASPGPNVPPEYRKMQESLSRRRIDLLLMKGIQPTIAELKDQIGLSAVGQLYTYKLLYMQENPGTPPPILIAVGYSIGPDVDIGLQAAGIKFELVR